MANPLANNIDGSNPNYIFVGEDLNEISVYDNHGEKEPRYFNENLKHERRANAERLAARWARELGCDWGTNY